MKVLVVHRREIFRKGLALVLQQEPTIEVVACCACPSEAIEKASHVKPDVMLIDSYIGEEGCIEMARRVTEYLPHTNVLILSHTDKDYDFLAACKAGARGYISKDVTIEDLVKAITMVAQGGVILSPQMAEKMLAEFSSVTEKGINKSTSTTGSLSVREQEVLSLVAKGASNKAIATSLFISENTVRVHLRNIMGKLDVHSRLEAASLLYEENIVRHNNKEGRR